MDQGKIIDSGDFNTLMKANRDFQRMVKLGNLDPAGNRVD
jgi:ABC-type multidrug transport system fused ATPase/permease subunit